MNKKSHKLFIDMKMLDVNGWNGIKHDKNMLIFTSIIWLSCLTKADQFQRQVISSILPGWYPESPENLHILAVHVRGLGYCCTDQL